MQVFDIKKIIYGVLGLFDGLLKCIFPPSTKTILYQSSPDFCDNAYYVYRHALQTRKRLRHVWLVEDEAIAAKIKSEFRSLRLQGDHLLTVCKRRSLSGYFNLLRSQTVFHTHGIYPFVRFSPRREVINLFHGMPIKCIGALNHISRNPFPTFGTKQIATSDFYRDVVAKAFVSDPNEVIVCRLPRCDVFASGEGGDDVKATIRSRLGVGNGKLIAWLPTYRSERLRKGEGRSFLDDIDDRLLSMLNEQAVCNDCHIVIKLHPYDPLNYQERRAGYSRIHMVTATDWDEFGVQLYDFLAVTDGLMTDISSVLLDYHLSGKPIAILGFDPNSYHRDLVFPFDMLKRSRRFCFIENRFDLASFMGQIISGRPVSIADDDLVHSLVVNFRQSGSEVVLEAAGI